jgi:LPS O-antigen subunit length determinant protein (WzzB/FepE family)
VNAEPETPRYRLFGEELGGDPPLLQLLAEAQENLQALADRYGADLSQDEQFELLDEALDELDAALERVREARAKLARIELRLATSYETAVARIRQAERDS